MDHGGSPVDGGSGAEVPVHQSGFFWARDFTLFFAGWTPRTPWLYVLTLAAVFTLSLAHEWLSRLRSTAGGRSLLEQEGYSHRVASASPPTKPPLLRLATEAAVYTAQTATGYLLMLAVMSYNAGVFLAILLGALLGFVVFRSSVSSPA